MSTCKVVRGNSKLEKKTTFRLITSEKAIKSSKEKT